MQIMLLLCEGVTYNVTGFEVGRCTKLYKITEHPFLLRFLHALTIVEGLDVGPIEREAFMLCNFDHLQALPNTNIELPMRCTKLYKITELPFIIYFLPDTTIVEITNVGPTIERLKFMLRNFDHQIALANTNIELPGNILP
ncbi:hypothetical protein ARALYDRAFT_901456 [Arabidopsis lyrata subsp. lyrata]|uniref:Uncharacterized protein n=1 Tax=Arabidopsis lyrata subsp. lyrata TaxID=81972 RepID=D7LES2_ARALL|nr:hypothetical protein ARALYDRAFT_901456 [Arabidopsis lyrata subsp. lyrata]